MALSGTYTWQLDVGEIIEEAYEKAGLGEVYTGYDAATARRSLNLILTEWMNVGVNLWTIDLATQALTVGTNSYTLSSETIDILEGVRRDADTNKDVGLNRISLETYLANRTNKTSSGSPADYALERNSNGGHTLYLWPTPNATDSIVYWRIRYPQDVSATGGNQTVDVPRRFIPALINGLAYELALKKNREMPAERLYFLKEEYETSLKRAMEEDRDRASLFLAPWVGYRL